MVHSAAAADVAEAMLAHRDKYTDEEWRFAKRMFNQHTKCDMEEAVKTGLGRGNDTNEGHRFGKSWHNDGGCFYLLN